MKTIFIICLLLLMSLGTKAQIRTQIAPRAIMSEKGVFNAPEKARVVKLPKVDVSRLLKEDSLEANTGMPFRFGTAIDVNYTLENSGTWQDSEKGRVWKLAIQSEGAFSLNFIFEDLVLPEGAEIFLYNNERTMMYGPINRENYGNSKNFGTDLIMGETVTIELYEPGAYQNTTKLRLAKVIHGYKNLFDVMSGFGSSMPCNNNVNCGSFSAWQDQSNSVAMVLLADNTRICSGSLLANTCGDFTPNFLTAFHCIDIGNTGDNPCDGEAGNGSLNATEIDRAENWLFRFQYKSPTCSPSAETIDYFTFNGSTYRSAWFNTDFALVEMNTVPDASTGIQYAGWSRSTSAPTSGATIHHPAGDVMKISTFSSSATNSTSINWFYGCPGQFNTTPASTHWTLSLTNGTSEGGSSGSPLFDQNGRVVGQLHGGGSSCAPVTMHYGKLQASWNGGGTAQTRLRDWLDPGNTGATTTNMTLIPGLTGDKILCTSEPYSITNLPTGATVTWTATPSGVVTISGSGSSVTLTKVGSANNNVTLKANINTGCEILSLEKKILVGAPLASLIDVTGEFDTYVGEEASFLAHYDGLSLCRGGGGWVDGADWTVDPAGGPVDIDMTDSRYCRTMFFPGAGAMLEFSTPGTKWLTVRMHNDCGWSAYANFFIDVSASFALKVFPNPASDFLTITESTDILGASKKMDSTGKPFRTVLMDQQGKTLASADSREGSTKLDVRNIPDGNYFLHITQGETVTKRQIVIKH